MVDEGSKVVKKGKQKKDFIAFVVSKDPLELMFLSNYYLYKVSALTKLPRGLYVMRTKGIYYVLKKENDKVEEFICGGYEAVKDVIKNIEVI